MIKRIASLLFAGLIAASTPAVAADKRTPPPDLGTMKGKEAEAFYLGLNAVIWGYPAVKFEELMEGRTKPEILKLGNPQSAVNQFGLVRQLRGPEFKQIATPNNDTVYAQAFCDVSREPLVISVPKVDDKRYYTLQLWDPNGDTFGYIGTRTTGREAGHYALVGPGWKGTLPAGVKRIDSPYNNFAIWGRVGVDGPSDLNNALAIQDQLQADAVEQVRRFRQAGSGRFGLFRPTRGRTGQSGECDRRPEVLCRSGERAQIYAAKATGRRGGGKPVADRVQGQQHCLRRQFPERRPKKRADQSGPVRPAHHGRLCADRRLVRERLAMEPQVRDHGQRLSVQGGFAKWFTGGNAPDEAIYMDARNDDKGKPFDGAKKYRIHFDKGQLPPAKAFWSVSMYNIDDGSFVENPIKRYTLGDRTPGIVTNDDGSFDIFIQHDAPTGPTERANWLPSPQGGFYLNLRLYVPDGSLQKGTWKPPVVQAAD